MFHVKHCFSRFFCNCLALFRYPSHTTPTTRPHNTRELVFHITRARVEVRVGSVRGFSGLEGDGGWGALGGSPGMKVMGSGER